MLASILFIVGVPLVSVFAIGTIGSAIKRRRATKKTDTTEKDGAVEEEPVKKQKMTREKAIEKLESLIKTLEKENQKANATIAKKVKGLKLEEKVAILSTDALNKRWNQMAETHKENIERRIAEIRKAPKSSDFEKMSSMGELTLNKFMDGRLFATIVDSIKEKYPAYEEFAKIDLNGVSADDHIFKQFEAYDADLRSQLIDSDVKAKSFQRDAHSKKTTLLQAMSTSSKVESMDKTLNSFKEDVDKLVTDLTGLKLDGKDYKEKLATILPKLRNLESAFTRNTNKTVEILNQYYKTIKDLVKALRVIESRFGSEVENLSSSIQKQIDSMKEKITSEYKERIFEVEKRIDRDIENLSLTSVSEIENCHKMIVALDRALYGMEESYDKRLAIKGKDLRARLKIAEERITAGYEKKITETEARFDKVIATKVVSKEEFEKYKKSIEEALKSNLELTGKTLKSMLKRLEALDKKFEQMKTVNDDIKTDIKILKKKVASSLAKKEVIELIRQEVGASEQKNSAKIEAVETRMKELSNKLTTLDIVELLNERVGKLETVWNSDKDYIDTRIETAKEELREFLKRSLAQRVGAKLDEKLKGYFKNHKEQLIELVEEVVVGMEIDVAVDDEETFIDTIVEKISEKYTLGFSKKK